MRTGCIDIGSNTTRLLVADSDGRRLVWVHQERVFTGIGHELMVRGELGPAKIAEVVAAVAAQLASAHEHGVQTVRAVATQAIRSAANGAELARAVSAATGLTVDVLSGEEEARLAYVGVAGTLEAPLTGELAVVDVGGGSSELVVGAGPDQIRWWASVPLGSATVAHAWLRSDPPGPLELDEARRGISAGLVGLRPPPVSIAIAVGGSATSLARLAGPVLDGAAVRRALGVLTSGPSPEIAARWAIDPERARLLPAGLLILAEVSEVFGTAFRVGRGGIREGVLLEACRR